MEFIFPELTSQQPRKKLKLGHNQSQRSLSYRLGIFNSNKPYNVNRLPFRTGFTETSLCKSRNLMKTRRDVRNEQYVYRKYVTKNERIVNVILTLI